nr:MAG TPA: hypothetical protein [Caudoviricetes sp.]
MVINRTSNTIYCYCNSCKSFWFNYTCIYIICSNILRFMYCSNC